jgi:DNA modification methylase
MINIVMKTKERLKLFVQSLNMGQNAFEAEVGIANGYLASKSQSVNSDAIEKIIIKYPSLNLDWLFTGNGDMSLGEDAKSIQVTSEPIKGSVPFYKELPVSAGKLEVLQQYVDKEEGQGWIKLPDVSAIAAFPVKGHSVRSTLHSVPDCQAIIKKSVVSRLSAHYGIEHFEETGPLYPIQFAIMKDIVTIYIDTTGENLYKRGYREKSVLAPMRETLAYSMIDLSFWRGDRIFIDPFCGSGTTCIAAVQNGRNYIAYDNNDEYVNLARKRILNHKFI